MADTQRDAIAEVYDQLAADEPASPEPAPEAPVEAGAGQEASEPVDDGPREDPPPDGKARDEKGRFAPRAAAPDGEKPAVTTKPKAKDAGQPTTAPPASAVGAVPPPDGAAPIQPPAAKGPKAPATWKIAVREKWDGLPTEVQAEILRREEEHVTLAATTAQQRRQWAETQQKLAPYEPYLRSLGVGPVDAAARLLQAEQTLRMGSMPQKKAIFATLARDYGLTPADIGEAMAEAQNGHAHPVMQPPQQFQDPRVDQLLALQQERDAAQVAAKIAEFGKTHEYLDDVRETMGDLLEGGAAKDLEEAYAIALALPKHKDLRDHIAAKEAKAAESAKSRAANVAKSKAAGGSVKSAPVEGTRTKTTTQRQAIAELYDELEQR